MSGVHPRYQHGPRSYQVSGLVKGGQVVIPDDANPGMIKACDAAGAATVLGVALDDANAYADQSGDTTGYGAPVVDASVLPDHTAVAYGGATVPVTFSGDADFGQKVAADGSGGVAAYSAAAAGSVGTFDAIIGVCDEPDGVTSGKIGLVRLT